MEDSDPKQEQQENKKQALIAKIFSRGRQYDWLALRFLQDWIRLFGWTALNKKTGTMALTCFGNLTPERRCSGQLYGERSSLLIASARQRPLPRNEGIPTVTGMRHRVRRSHAERVLYTAFVKRIGPPQGMKIKGARPTCKP